MRKVMLGAAALLLVGATGVVPRSPAGAQETGGYVTWQSPEDGARTSGQTFHIKAKAGFYGGVKSWAVEVLAPEDADYPGYGTVCERSESRAPAYVNIDCVWDTTAYPNDGGPAQNRPYVVRVTVQGGAVGNGQQSAPFTDDRGVIVSNPVAPPRDVHLSFVDSTRQATIQWRPNTEPDIVSYVVQERIGDGPWKSVGQAGGKVTNFTRTLSAPGTYRYQVAALRSAGSDKDTLQSAWSGPASDPRQIVVAEPKRPETTTTTLPAYSADSAGDTGAPAAPADPGNPNAPAPSSAAGTAGDPAAPGAPAPAGSDTSRSGALISPIQPGAPGSVRSGGATVGGPGLTAPKTTKTTKEQLEESEGPDTGFSQQLPYKQDGNADKEDGVAGGRVLVGLPEAIGSDDARHLLVPLASGLLLFVFAMHAFYVSRRAAVEAPLDVDE
jgi:hypothetical protein